MGPIQVIPPGLTGLLQLKTFGQLPGYLSDTVAGVIELRDWYLTARRLSEVALLGGTPSAALATGNTGIRGFTNPVPVVPNGQYWWVEQMTIDISPTGAEVATDLIRFACALGSGAAGLGQALGVDVSDYTLAARSRDLRCKIDRGFWAVPGDQLALLVSDIVTTNGYTATLGFRATPCPV